MLLRRLLLTIALALALALAPSALASGGHYVFDGGTHAQQAQVRAALDASSFDYSVVNEQVTIHIQRGIDTAAKPGEIWLDGGLLDAGSFSWGVVQHEYAHQVDFLVLTDAQRAQLHTLLGGTAWCSGAPHDELDCERFADLVSWAYWTSPANVLKPATPIAPAAFRAALGQILPAPARQLAVVQVKRAPRKR